MKTAATAAAALARPLVGWSQVLVGGITDGGVRRDSSTTTGSIKSQGSGLQAGSQLTISGIEVIGPLGVLNTARFLSGAVGTCAKGAANRTYIAGVRHNF